MNADIIKILRNKLPDCFPGTMLDSLTSNLLRWRTIQNKRSQKKIPESCFKKISARKVVIYRDSFLDWFATTLPEATEVNYVS